MSTNQPQLLKLLSEVEVLEPLSTEQLKSFSQRIPERSYQIGEDVYIPGEASECVYLLLEGRIRLYGMVGEEEFTFEIIHSGEMFGVASLMEHTQDEYAQALEPSRVGLLNLNAFWDLLRENPIVNAKVIRLLGKRLRSSRSQLLDVALKGIPARLASLLLALVHEEGVVTREGHYKIPTHYTRAVSNHDRGETGCRYQGFWKTTRPWGDAASETPDLYNRLRRFGHFFRSELKAISGNGSYYYVSIHD